MTSVTPSTVLVQNQTHDREEGTTRRLFEAYIECSPASTDYTLNLATYVPNVSTISGIIVSGDSSGLYATITSMATFSTTTLTFPTPGLQYCKVIGYYT